jgi:hypothetical protein
MTLPSLSIAAFLLVALASYAQTQIPRFTEGRGHIMAARGVLIATGIGLGAVSAAIVAADTPQALLVFLIGFGAVHIPAAFILLVKQARHSGKS